MLKWKIITAVSVVITIILCMMTIYVQREYYFVQMVNQRDETDLMTLKKDYEKLYDAYYSYDKKILKILEGNKNVFWAKDSSAYVVFNKEKNTGYFSFYKKPRITEEYFLWQYVKTGCMDSTLPEDLGMADLSRFFCRVDTLKPHQFILLGGACPITEPLVATKNLDTDKPEKILFSISIK